ncbi:LuxR C-terminal-related transcriptional regulator [Streptomyces sp. NBC_00704]|uniref:helix-turn-helix transcriptional regulator n=1 Tax=Streptomyces sp. NBC_00704 TaxID=2975809 RepID=UPI002E32C396|nr:AAA family ATPase [Streptomyces sp. NBC_00704]
MGHSNARTEIDLLLERVAKGVGTLAVVNGPTGVGKSTLLRALADRSRAAGATVFSTCALPEERNEPFSVVQQLLAQTNPETPLNGHGTSGHTSVWSFVAQLAQSAVAALTKPGPVVLVVDDIHHADPLSIRCLRLLTARFAPLALPLSVFVSWDATVEATSPILQEMLYETHVCSVSLALLNSDAVARMIAARNPDPIAVEMASHYHALSGGNPLLVSALVEDSQVKAAVKDNELPGSDCGPFAGDAFQRAVQVCLHRMGALARLVAQGVALLGENCDEYQLSELCEAPLGLIRTALRRLQASGLLVGGAFRHKRVREIVLSTIPSATVIEMHHRAARLLHAHGAPPEAIAFHLLAAGPVKDTWGLPVLRDAARHALAAGQMDLGIRCLKLADASCTDDRTRYEIKAQLAEICAMVELGGALARYQSLKTSILTGLMAPDTALPVAQAMLWNAQVHDAVEVIDSIVRRADVDRPDICVEMQVTELQIASSFPGVQRPAGASAAARSRPAAAALTADASPAVRARLQAHQSLLSVLTGNGDAYIAAQAEQSLQTGSLFDASVRACVVPAVLTLIYSSSLDSAQRTANRFLTSAAESELPGWTAVLRGLLAMIALRRGELDVAVEHSTAALAPARNRSLDTHGWLALATLAEAHTSIGNHDMAAQCFATAAAPALFQTRSGLHYLYARGRHHLAGGRPYAALADFLTCGKQAQQWDMDTPVLVPWRVGAAEAWLSLDQKEKAAGLLEAQLAMRGFGSTRSRGMALRALAATRDFKERLTILDKSMQLLQAGGDRYELVRCLADLSSAHRAIGDKDKARTAGLRARRMAKVCNADTVPEALMVAAPALEPTAEWPVKIEHDFDKLSKSEQRVATLAARGLTNREIAQELFVTVSTVEQHLTRVYKKMKVRSREDLPVKLRATAA